MSECDIKKSSTLKHIQSVYIIKNRLMSGFCEKVLRVYPEYSACPLMETQTEDLLEIVLQ